MKNIIVDFVYKHFDTLLKWDFILADKLGAPKGHTLSGNAYRTEQAGKPWGKFWRPRIDAIFMFLIGQEEHCRKAYEAEVRKLNA